MFKREAVGREMCWDILGTVDGVAMAELRDDPGTLAEERWKSLDWAMPAFETDLCWWIMTAVEEIAHLLGVCLGSARPTDLVTTPILFFNARLSIARNAAEEDKTKPHSFLCRPVACLRLELNQTRCATSVRLRQTYEKRAEDPSFIGLSKACNGGIMCVRTMPAPWT